MVTQIEDHKSVNFELLLFYLITFLFSWGIWVPQALTHAGIVGDNAYVAYFDSNPWGAFGPLVASIILTVARGGFSGAKQLFASAFSSTYGKKWLLPSVVLIPVLWISALNIGVVFDGFQPLYMWAENPAMLIIVPLWVLMWGGPVQEEFGWRGFALSRWQAKYNSLTASTIVGFLWGFWHVPLYFIPSQTIYYNKPMLGLFVSTILLSIIMTWIYNYTQSMQLMLFFHTMFNASHALIPVLDNDVASFWHMLFLAAFVGIVVLKEGVHLGNNRMNENDRNVSFSENVIVGVSPQLLS